MSRIDRHRTLLIAGLAFVIVLIIWRVPDISAIVFPFRYFVTTIHELGHGLAAILGGGQFIKYEVFSNGAGVATTAGGPRWLVLPAGYVGTAMFGAALLYLTNRTRHTRAIAMALGAGFAILTVLFARNLTAFIAGLLTAVILTGLGWKVTTWVTTLVLNVLAMLTGLNAVLDLWGLLNSLNNGVVSRLGNVPNDAYHMATSVGILPAAIWAFLWTGIAVALLGFSAYLTFWRPVANHEV